MSKAQALLASNLSFVAKALDSFGTSLLGFIIFFFYAHTFVLPTEYAAVLIINILMVLIFFPKFKLYTSWRGRSRWQRSALICYAWFTVLACLLIISFMLKNSAFFSRLWFFTWGASGFAYLLAYRKILDMALDTLRMMRINRKRILVYGAGVVGRKVSSRLLGNYEVGFDIVGFIDDNPKLYGESIDGAKVYPPSEMLSLLNDCSEMWIALPLRSEPRVMEILHQTRHLTCVIRFIPDIFNFRLLNHSVTEIANIPIIEINGTPMSSGSRLAKRIEDIIISSLILILISPLLLLIGALIKMTSKGPILYKQERHGWNGQTIKVYKFRSMFFEKDSCFKQATAADPRITPLGKFLRKTSLDELPQFFNVLQGRMSIVGPRPHAIIMNLEYQDKIDNYMQRHKVKPGITGWAQVNGFRGETNTIDKMEKRVEYDLYYIQHWSLYLDIKIILMTFFKVFADENAY